MSFIGGYQSDVNLNGINFVGDFPIDHSIGGFGITTGVDNYLLALNPPIAQYRQGLPLEVKFSQVNIGAVTLNVDSNGAKPIKKIVGGTLVNIEAGELTTSKIYLLIYDGVNFQIASGGSASINDASEIQKGIAQIATTQEITLGEDNTKIVTPAKLAAYVANKITGLWEDKGILNCIGNPNYPAGVVGDAYTISVGGKIGGVQGQNVGVRDVVYCRINNPGGIEENVGNAWTIIQANLEPSTEIIAGYIRIATQFETNEGLSNTTGVTPLKLLTLLNILLKYQAGDGAGSIMPKIGAGNIAQSSFAAVLNGQNNRARGAYSTAMGFFADSLTYNEWAKAAGGFYNTKGSSQNSILNLLNIVPPNSGIFPITPDGAGASGSNRWLPPGNCIQQFTAQFTVTQNSGTAGTTEQAWTGIFEGVLKNTGGTLSWLGGAPTLREVRQDAGFSPSLGFLIGGGEITAFVEGMAERSLHVSVTVYITQTKFGLS